MSIVTQTSTTVEIQSTSQTRFKAFCLLDLQQQKFKALPRPKNAKKGIQRSTTVEIQSTSQTLEEIEQDFDLQQQKFKALPRPGIKCTIEFDLQQQKFKALPRPESTTESPWHLQQQKFKALPRRILHPKRHRIYNSRNSKHFLDVVGQLPTLIIYNSRNSKHFLDTT